MKKLLCTILAMVMTLSFSTQIFASSVSETENESAVFTDITPAELLNGYSPHPDLNQGTPVILSMEEKTEPSPHLKVSGRFGDGDAPQFNIYLPPKAQWEGRFFQHLHPFLEIDIAEETMGFHFDSGGYSITVPSFTMGFNAAASAAHLSRTIAKNYYDYDEKIYGYVYGGSGAPYAGLTDMEKEVLEEVTRLGVPLRAWEDYEYLLGIDENGKTTLLENGMNADYVNKFWNAPGYLGTEDSELGELFRELRASGDYTDSQLAAGPYHRYAIPDERYYAWDHIREKNYVSFGTN